MRLIRLMLVAFVLCTPSAALSQDWSDFMSTEDRFSITFPGQPSVQEIKWPSEYGAVFPGRVYSVKAGVGTYSVTVIDYRESEKLHSAIAKPESCKDPP